MTERKSIDALFQKDSNYTKSEFKSKYLELKALEQEQSETMSIFSSDLDDSIDNIFDALNTNGNDTLDNDEIDTLLNYSSDKNQNSVSEGDLGVLYKNTIEQLKYKLAEQKEANNKLVRYTKNEIKQAKSNNTALDFDIPHHIISARLSMEALSEQRKLLSQAKIQSLQNELLKLMRDEVNMSSEQKKEYQKNVDDINKQKAEKARKESELKSTQEALKHANAEIDYIKEHKSESDKNKKELNNWQEKSKELSQKCNSISKDIKSIDKIIKKLYSNNERLISKSKNSNSNIEQQKKYLTNSIKEEENAIKSYTQICTSESAELEKTEKVACKASTTPYSKEYYDEDTSHFSYDAQELKSKWAKSKPNLSDGFYNKVVEISKRIGCDPNALMGVMNAESGISTTVSNKKSGATGLIQFMPKTAKSLGTSTDALKNMSQEEQLTYVEKYLTDAKRMAKIGSDEKLDSGTLYALVFMPAKAKQNIFAEDGTKEYEWNIGLDRDHDHKITKADLAVQVKKFMK